MPTATDIDAALAAIFADVFERGDIAIRPGLTAADVPGWDSFRQLEIVAACEQRFGLQFTSRELDGFHRLGDLAEAIRRKTGGA